MKPLKLLVLFGGKSNEHEGSIESALHVLSYINLNQFCVHAIYIRPDGSFALGEEMIKNLAYWLSLPDISPFPDSKIPPADFFNRIEDFALGTTMGVPKNSHFLTLALNQFYDLAFPIFHGLNGEDGTAQGFLDFLNIPYIGPSVLSSALCMDKEKAKQVCLASGLSVTPWVSFQNFFYQQNPDLCFQKVEENFSYPVFIKPASSGSSLGLFRAENRLGLEKGLNQAFCFDEKVLVEKMMVGQEYAVGVIGNHQLKVSVPAQFMSSNPLIFDYEAKFGPQGLKDLIPAPLNPKETKMLQEFSLKVYQALELSVMARVDSFIQDGQCFFNEVNTIPGFGGHSVFNQLWEFQHIDKAQLIKKLADYALERKKNKAKLTYQFLNSFSSSSH